MLKTLTIALASTVIGAGSAATAHACGGGCCMSMSHSGMNMAPMNMDRMEGMEMSPAPEAPSAARSTRRYSYEPSMRSYSAPRTRSFRSSPNSLPKSDPGRYNF